MSQSLEYKVHHRSSSNRNSKHIMPSLPPLVQEESTYQNQPIPRKYKRIPRRIQYEQIHFNFPPSVLKSYKFKSSQSFEYYQSPYKAGNSLHQKNDNPIQSKKQLCFSSKKNINSDNGLNSTKLSENMGKNTFYKVYTNKTKTEHHSAEKSLISGILSDLDKYALIPKCIESLRQSQHKKIQFKRQALNNNNKLKLIGNVMEKSGKYSMVDLSNNSLKQNSSKIIIDKMVGVQDINLSGNCIGVKGVTSLCILFSNPTCKIKSLNVSNNNIADHLLAIPLTFLKLSQNHGNRKMCIQLKTLIKHNHLVDLDLSWNKIDSVSAFHLIQAIRGNTSIKFLNLAWNSIGNSEKLKESVCKMIKKNEDLIHLNLSYCSFTKEQYQSMVSYIESNKNLIGFHCEGSCAFLDGRGYLNITPLNKTFYEPQNISKLSLKNSKTNMPTCWICQQWKQFKFDWKSQKSNSYYIHFSFQKYESTLLERMGQNIYFKRFVPPIQFCFFLSYEEQGELKLIVLDKYKKVKDKINYKNQILNQVNIYKQTKVTDFKNLQTDIVPRGLPQIKQEYTKKTLIQY